MNHKTVALLMTAAIMACSCSPAFAEETFDQMIYWNEANNIIADHEELAGDFVIYDELGLELYVPSSLQSVELTDDEIANGFLSYYAVDGTAGLAVTCYDVPGVSMDEYTALVSTDESVHSSSTIAINGIRALLYTIGDQEITEVISIITDNKKLVEFSFTPADNETYADLATLMLSSIQVAEY